MIVVDISASIGIMPMMQRFSDQIRRAVKDCGQTRYAIAKATGISQSTLSRFMNSERGLPMGTLDVLAEHLGLQITVKPKRERRGG